MDRYAYISLMVDATTFEVEEVFGVIKEKDKYILSDPAEPAAEGEYFKIALAPDTRTKSIETIYAHASPGYRYVRVGGTWKRIPVPQ